MDAAPDYAALYTQAIGDVRRIIEAFQELTVVLDEAVTDLAARHAAACEAEGKAGADADEDGDDEAGDAALPLEGCGTCTQFTPCPDPGVGCYVNPPAPDPCTACDESDDEFCGYHSGGWVHPPCTCGSRVRHTPGLHCERDC